MTQTATHSSIVIDAQGIYKDYHRGSTSTPVLRNISLEVRSGECVFLLGPSGSGKSTLLSILGCVLSPDAGEIRLLGRNVQHLSPQGLGELRRDHIGFIFQRFHLIRGLSVLENVSLPMMLRGELKSIHKKRARDLLVDMGLEAKIHASPSTLSVGQCQRVAIARALANDPEILLADEPTASLDAETGQDAMSRLRGLAHDHGKGVIVVTHDTRILPFADRVLQIQNGELFSMSKATESERPMELVSTSFA